MEEWAREKEIEKRCKDGEWVEGGWGGGCEDAWWEKKCVRLSIYLSIYLSLCVWNKFMRMTRGWTKKSKTRGNECSIDEYYTRIDYHEHVSTLDL